MAIQSLDPSIDPITGQRIFTVPEGAGLGGYSTRFFSSLKQAKKFFKKSKSSWNIFSLIDGTYAVESDRNAVSIKGFKSGDILDLPGDNPATYGIMTPPPGSRNALVVYRTQAEDDILAVVAGNPQAFPNGITII